MQKSKWCSGFLPQDLRVSLFLSLLSGVPHHQDLDSIGHLNIHQPSSECLEIPCIHVVNVHSTNVEENIKQDTAEAPRG